MRFVWFWTFWHWSRESFRTGSLLRGPLQGIGGHWDEWFRHEASEHDLTEIAELGRSESRQRQFMAWLYRHWLPQTEWRGKRTVPHFMLSQLAQVPPFNQWPAFERFRTSYGVKGISALVLTDQSAGEAEDVRTVEAIALPAEPGIAGVAPEGFHTEAAELEPARSAAKSLLRGKGLLIFLAKWMIGGRRPYPGWLRVALSLGWLTMAGLIVFLLVGPEPGEKLFLFSAGLVGLWGGLILAAIAMIATESFRAWRTGTDLSRRLEQCQVRVRMNGGLTLKGGSAGLPFCLNMLLALYHAAPGGLHRSWIWRRFLRGMHSGAGSWAGTGVISMNGYLSPVVIGPKLRACLRHNRIQHILTPRQREATKSTLDLVQASSGAVQKESPAHLPSSAMQVGFAAEKPHLHIHRCRHVAQSMMVLGHFRDRWQIAGNALALAVSGIMLAALPDLRSILLPHPAPMAVEPASSSPYYLWVSLNTEHPEYFSAVLESSYWSNRRADVKRCSGMKPSVRAEIYLHRMIGRGGSNNDDGTVWIERRERFLTREFLPGARVGRYSITYLSRIGHE